MNARVISVGTKVDITLKGNLGTKVACHGEFIQILNDNEVIVFCNDSTLPLGFSKLVWVNAVFPHQWYGMLKFSGILIKKDEMKSGTRLHVKIDEFEETQKREYFRPTCNLSASYRNKYNINNEFKPAKTKDISFSGVCIQFLKAEEISINDTLDIKVCLKDNLIITMMCKVLRVSEFEHTGKKYYELGMSIDSIDEEDKAVLKEYITANAIVDSVYWKEID